MSPANIRSFFAQPAVPFQQLILVQRAPHGPGKLYVLYKGQSNCREISSQEGGVGLSARKSDLLLSRRRDGHTAGAAPEAS